MTEESQMIALLSEAVRWLRFQGLDKAKAAVAENLNTDKKKHVYELTDGKVSSRDIARLTGVGVSTVSEWWTEWYSAGIVAKENNAYRHLFSLSQIGVKIDTAETKRKVRIVGGNAK